MQNATLKKDIAIDTIKLKRGTKGVIEPLSVGETHVFFYPKPSPSRKNGYWRCVVKKEDLIIETE